MVEAAVTSGEAPGQEGGLQKRSVTLAGHRTSIALEKEFWEELDRLAHDQGIALSRLIETCDSARLPGAPLASSLRLLVLKTLKDAAAAR